MKRMSLGEKGSVVLLLDGKSRWSPEKWAMANGGRTLEPGTTIFGNVFDWVSICRNDSAYLEQYGTQYKTCSNFVSGPAAYLLSWDCHWTMLEKLLAAVPKSCNAVLDNRRGMIAPLESLGDLPVALWQLSGSAPQSRRIRMASV